MFVLPLMLLYMVLADDACLEARLKLLYPECDRPVVVPYDLKVPTHPVPPLLPGAAFPIWRSDRDAERLADAFQGDAWGAPE